MINETAICEFHSSCLELRQTIYVTIYNLLLDADHSAVSFKENWLEYFFYFRVSFGTWNKREKYGRCKGERKLLKIF